MFSYFVKHSQSRRARGARVDYSCGIERLEDRRLLTTFTVLNLGDQGAGSLRQAMLDANQNAGADVIRFEVAGLIALTSAALPTLTDTVDIDGTTAPDFSGTPAIQVDYNGFGGLQFNAGSAGSALRSLALVDGGGNGVTLNGVGNILVTGNYIGLGIDGATAAGNRGVGVEIIGASGSVIGGFGDQGRNVISANGRDGILVNGSSGNQISGNFIGTDATGTLDRGNAANGILLTAGAAENDVGATGMNLISGNDANGVLINGNATLNRVSGNLIGLNAAGDAALGNRLDGVSIASASHNLIGQVDPITGVTYNNADNVDIQPVSAWQGIRSSDTTGQFLIVGTSGDNGLLFDGTIEGEGTSYLVNYPGAAATSVYGPDNLDGNNIRLVGIYKNADALTADVSVHGFVFEGTTDELGESANYRTIDFPGAKFNYVHSTMGGLAVGNYDSPLEHDTHSLPLGPGHAYIYDLSEDVFITDIVFPGSLSNTAYGIWHNGGTSYTICGGYSLDPLNNLEDPGRAIGKAYLVDYDSSTSEFSNFTSFDYPNGDNFVTHFEGISSVEPGVYTLNADSLQSGSDNPAQGSFVTVRRNDDGSFGPGDWVDLNFPGLDPTTNVTSSNSVIGNQVVGLVIGEDAGISYQATIDIAFQLSNVISGNGGNGIGLYGAHDNNIAMNYIGTDVAGTIDLGNAQNGILITSGSARNLIGGVVTGGNDPTGNVFARPPQGNLISGNNANGVFITDQATQNQLSGNFIGTDASGNVALGNSLDGVAIVNADNNSLIGCTLQQNPFVYYNVISGNAGNGLRVDDSNDTTIQANFFGMGANNNTALGNALNGVVIEGASTRTIMGGPIPLGNVVAANGRNGLVVQDQASEFTTYNTFCGLAAFSLNPNFGNALDGMLITSTGSNILIRTNVITSNGDDGIEVSGKARGVRIAGNIIGLNTSGLLPMGNFDNGIEIGGKARDIIVGGPQPTFNIIPENVISANGNNGVAILGKARDIVVSHSYIGTIVSGEFAQGNLNAGVSVGAKTRRIQIGSTDPELLTVISGNLGNGIEMQSTRKNTVIGTYVGTDANGTQPLGNSASGIYLVNSRRNTIGSTSDVPKNIIAFNGTQGVFIESGTRNGIRENSIHTNGGLGIDLGSGANRDQPAPVLTSAETLPGGIVVTGTLTGKRKATFTVEYFASDVDGSSGRVFLGSQKVTTDGSGVAALTFQGMLPPLGADFITATATDKHDNTSELSAAVSSIV